ncbi:E3 ubiquitin-protein ligase ATL41-like [Macadamia integrifolia]|uniref:E3 ubiquitin-protein ligase ATL41-like n=1 Tax=Macadamia integrifolia TaxID=60698 RepID=UPI001C4F427E|nr:E3 ubiquitin-protein ligase ATL41-like [Macadamia integrifolia]
MAGFIRFQSTNFNTTINGAAALVFLVITTIIVLHSLRCIYGRCLLRRHYRRRSGGGGGGGGDDQPIPELFIAIGGPQQQFSSLEPPKTGLLPSVIAALPTFIYKKPDNTDGAADAADTAECSICLSTLEEEETVKLLPNCLHVFHTQCIDMWLSAQTTCPICRAVAEPHAPPVAAEQEQAAEEAQSHGTGDEVVPPPPPSISSAPLEPLNSMAPISSEGTSEESSSAQSSKVVDESSSGLSSFHKIFSRRERSGRRIQPFEVSANGMENP